MATAFRVNIGSVIRFLPATEDKPAKAYARLAETQWEHVGDQNGKPVFKQREDTRWMDGEFTGDAAVILNDTHQKGDALIVTGMVREHTREYQGKQITSERLHVSAFGPDVVRYDSYQVWRKERATGTEQAPVQEQRYEQPPAQAVYSSSTPSAGLGWQ